MITGTWRLSRHERINVTAHTSTVSVPIIEVKLFDVKRREKG